MSTSPYTLAARAYRWKLRLEVFTKICGGTPRCQCPGCDVWYLGFLQLDHIDGKGAAHRLENKLGTGGAKLWKWARDKGYPPGLLQVLCRNCNGAKFTGAHCPLHGQSHTGKPDDEISILQAEPALSTVR